MQIIIFIFCLRENSSISLSFEIWDQDKVQVSTDRKRAEGKLSYGCPAIFTNVIELGRPFIARLRILKVNKWTIFGISFGETDQQSMVYKLNNSWSISAGVDRNTYLFCRHEQSGEYNLQIHEGSILELYFDPPSKRLDFKVDGIKPFPTIQVDIKNLNQMRVAVNLFAKTTVELMFQ